MVKVKPVQLGKTERMSFSRIDEVIDMPNLIEVQKNSYNWFLKEGLKEVFRDISTIEDYSGNLVLDFIDYRHNTTVMGFVIVGVIMPFLLVFGVVFRRFAFVGILRFGFRRSCLPVIFGMVVSGFTVLGWLFRQHHWGSQQTAGD